MEGYFLLPRKIQETPKWNDDTKFDKRSAWIDMLLMANFKDTKISFEGNEIDIKQGSFITSKLKLSKRWKWSICKVTHFFKQLTSSNEINTISDNKKTTISIVDYPPSYITYSDKRNEKESKAKETINQSKTDTKVTKVTNKEYKEKAIKVFSENEDLDKTFYAYINMRNKIKKPITDYAIKLLMIKLNKLSTNDKEQIQILEQSIFNSWQGVFPLKEDFNKKENSPASYKSLD
jgi:hypothetical protein